MDTFKDRQYVNKACKGHLDAFLREDELSSSITIPQALFLSAILQKTDVEAEQLETYCLENNVLTKEQIDMGRAAAETAPLAQNDRPPALPDRNPARNVTAPPLPDRNATAPPLPDRNDSDSYESVSPSPVLTDSDKQKIMAYQGTRINKEGKNEDIIKALGIKNKTVTKETTFGDIFGFKGTKTITSKSRSKNIKKIAQFYKLKSNETLELDSSQPIGFDCQLKVNRNGKIKSDPLAGQRKESTVITSALGARHSYRMDNRLTKAQAKKFYKSEGKNFLMEKAALVK